MKRSISKHTTEYLDQLNSAETKGDIEDYIFKPDSLDILIQNHKLKIVGLNFYPDLDLLLFVLNNKKVMKRKISDFKNLKNAGLKDLEKYFISKDGVHWEKLDEDLSLRGLLQYELTHSDVALSY
ncbi:Protein of unknown function [Aquiflexum balticum DSM 16537]|uniref:DUF2442 domain-containing protein n=1 Tax=Aquiflexum balticum DSM 16537 TaxID=758820 RepID=A0A1W2H2W7_9BACT|nr:DUF2442 domain-containing protein [Aquiflexum balticum]SMD43273.1 Protein of unknown function [Aquiflexum balticum DSM 16537]